MKPILNLFIIMFLFSSANATEINIFVADSDLNEPLYILKNNQPQGVIIDLYQEIFSESGFTIQIHALPDARLKSYIESHEIKNWVSYGAPTWYSYAKDKVEFTSSSFYLIKQVLIHPSNQGTQQITVPQMENLELAVIHGFYYPWFQNTKTTFVKSVKAGFSMLNDQRVSHFLFVYPEILYFLDKHKNMTKEFVYTEIDGAPQERVYLMFDKLMANEIKNLINSKFKALIENKHVASLFQKYGMLVPEESN